MNANSPTISTDFEGDTLFGNREGFSNLRDRIDVLLSEGSERIFLYEDEDYEDCFTFLSLEKEAEEQPEESSAIAMGCAAIVFSVPIFVLIGVVQSLRWLINLF